MSLPRSMGSLRPWELLLTLPGNTNQPFNFRVMPEKLKIRVKVGIGCTVHWLRTPEGVNL